MANDYNESPRGKSHYIEILKCNDKNKQVPECAPRDQIDNFVSRVTVKSFKYQN